jgi:predicted nucleotidyltransferase
MNELAIKIPFEDINQFCTKWLIKELSVFGSVLRDDFNQDSSDIDVLVEFLPTASWGWEIASMKKELEIIFKRSVDLVSKRAIERSRNPFRKKEILESFQVIYDQTA